MRIKNIYRQPAFVQLTGQCLYQGAHNRVVLRHVLSRTHDVQGRPTQRIDPQRLSTVAHCSLQFLCAQSINGANVFLLLNFAVFSLPASIAQDIENGQRVCSFLLPTVVNRTSLLQVLGDGHQVALLLLDHFQLFLPGCLLFLVARTGPFQFQVSFGQQLHTRERGVVFCLTGSVHVVVSTFVFVTY